MKKKHPTNKKTPAFETVSVCGFPGKSRAEKVREGDLILFFYVFYVFFFYHSFIDFQLYPR